MLLLLNILHKEEANEVANGKAAGFYFLLISVENNFPSMSFFICVVLHYIFNIDLFGLRDLNNATKHASAHYSGDSVGSALKWQRCPPIIIIRSKKAKRPHA